MKYKNEGIQRRKFIKDVTIAGTAALTTARLAGIGSEGMAASLQDRKTRAQDVADIGELKSINIKCLSETGWFDTNLLLSDINRAGGMSTSQYDIPWDHRNPGGYSALIEAEELDGRIHRILLDTGWSIPYMDWVFQRERVSEMLRKHEIEFAVISHEHLDHFWGLPTLSKYNDDLELVVPSTMTSRGWDLIKGCHKESAVKQISPGVINKHFPGFATVLFDISIILGVQGETVLYFNIKDKGIVIVTGCGHPTPQVMIDFSVNNIATKSAKNYGLYGGLHIAMLEDWNPAAQEMLDAIIAANFSRIGSNHCTGVIAVEKMIENGLPVVTGAGNFCSKSNKYVGNGDTIAFD